MIWEKEADAAIKKVPFFVRKKVRSRVETFVSDKGGDRVTLKDVQALKKKFLSKGGMEKEIKGYDFSACFGGEGCPNSVAPSTGQLVKDIEALMEKGEYPGFSEIQRKGGSQVSSRVPGFDFRLPQRMLSPSDCGYRHYRSRLSRDHRRTLFTM